MKEILDQAHCLNYVQIELGLELSPTERVYTPHSIWDSLEQESCDIFDQQCFSLPGSRSAPGNEINTPAHQHLHFVGEQVFIEGNQLRDEPLPQCLGVGAQVKEDTREFAPQHEKLVHWVEKYWVERAGNKYWYFRYRWMSGRKSNRVYLGSVRSRRVQEKVELVREAMQEGKSPCEIKQLIKCGTSPHSIQKMILSWSQSND